MLSFKRFFLFESPDSATFTYDGMSYTFALGTKSADDEICFTILNNGLFISSKDFTKEDIKRVENYTNVLLTNSPTGIRLGRTSVYTHFEICTAYIIKNNNVTDKKDFLSKWNTLRASVDIEGRAWFKQSNWFVSLHGNKQSSNSVRIFDILNTYDFYFEDQQAGSTIHINRDTYLPVSTPLKQRSLNLQKKIQDLRSKLHITTGNEKKAIQSLLDYFDR